MLQHQTHIYVQHCMYVCMYTYMYVRPYVCIHNQYDIHRCSMHRGCGGLAAEWQLRASQRLQEQHLVLQKQQER